MARPSAPFSVRTARDRTPNRLARALDEARAKTPPPIDLTVSNPTVVGLPAESDAILAALADPRALRYEPDPFGLRAAREALAAALAPTCPGVSADRLVLTASTSEAYAFLFDLLADPGDEILVPAPSYPLLDHLAALEAVRLVPYRLAWDGEWHVDLASVRAALGPRTRAIVLVSPNHPTGSFTKRDELARLAELGLPLVSDEVFAPYAFGEDPRRASSVLEAGGTLAFALSGLSKLAALPQLKLGWIAVGGPDALVTEALGRLELVADTFLSVGAPVQHAVPALLAAGATARAAIRARTAENLVTLRAAVGPSSAATVLPVEGGWVATVRVPATRTDEAWALLLLERDRVVVHPGFFYDFPEGAWLVLSLLPPPADFAEGVRRLVARVDADGA